MLQAIPRPTPGKLQDGSTTSGPVNTQERVAVPGADSDARYRLKGTNAFREIPLILRHEA